MARVLVTGASGFVGAAVTRWLARRDFAVGAVTREGSNLWRLNGSPKAISRYHADLIQPSGFQAVVAKFRPDAILHSAMYSGHPDSEAGRWACLQSSVLATQTVVEAALRNHVGRIIFVGSSTVYRQSADPLTESSPFDPMTCRGAAKAASAIWFRQFVRQHGLKGLELRLFSVYGPWESPRRFLPVLLRAADSGESVPLKRGPRHDFVYIDDVCRAFERALSCDTYPGEVVNIGSGMEHSNEEAVAAVERVTGRTIAIAAEPHPGHPPDTEHWRADIGKAKSLLNWTPEHTLDSGLAQTAEWMASRKAAACAV